jgi:hypothetical protein
VRPRIDIALGTDGGSISTFRPPSEIQHRYLPHIAKPHPANARVISKATRFVQNPLAMLASVTIAAPMSQSRFGPLHIRYESACPAWPTDNLLHVS